jgi:hypothetical protein
VHVDGLRRKRCFYYVLLRKTESERKSNQGLWAASSFVEVAKEGVEGIEASARRRKEEQGMDEQFGVEETTLAGIQMQMVGVSDLIIDRAGARRGSETGRPKWPRPGSRHGKKPSP